MKFNFSARLLTVAVIAFAGAAIAPSNAFAATTANVGIGGTVNSTLDIAATPTAAATTLNLTAGEKIAKVADLAITTNNTTGYTLTATEGNMVRTGQEAVTPIAFKVTTTADAAAAPVAGDFTGTAGLYTYADNATAGADPRDLYVTYTPTAAQDPGAYTATITLTVLDK
jgi:hypothetical protein